MGARTWGSCYHPGTCCGAALCVVGGRASRLGHRVRENASNTCGVQPVAAAGLTAAWCRFCGLVPPQAVGVAPAAPPRGPSVPANLHGFSVVRQERLVEYNADAVLFRHTKTGAEVRGLSATACAHVVELPLTPVCPAWQLMSVSCDDENKCFSVVLRTPPADSTGIPHILEHSVLCGSRKYPCKEPFVELMKSSLNTFLNAFTYPDRTCYPVASTNLADFRNLVDVYLDAVFHPKCVTDELTFQQEGWHYELDAPGGELSFKGVVFNEMKGVYSSPDSILARETQRALFPDNTYGVDSGGDPEDIPKLSFAQFQDFHARYYHPSNARFWFYGDDAVEARLQTLDAYLREFTPRPSVQDSAIHPQPLFSAPRRVTAPYAAGGGEDEDGEGAAAAAPAAAGAAPAAAGAAPKHYVTVNWVLSEKPLDTQTSLALGFLDHLMLGTPAAPLRQALEASGLGEALTGGGLEDELLQPTYGVGLKGVAPGNVAAVEQLIHDTLTKLSVEGFTQQAVDASVNTIEFSLRENNTGRFPRGLSLMLRSVTAWIYDRDAFEPLRFEQPLAALKARLAAGDDVFRPLIKQFLLNNTHKVTVELTPDTQLSARREAGEQAKLQAKRSTMGAADLDALFAATEALKTRQETPDSPEAVACVPSLRLGDIPKEPTTVPSVVSTSGGATVLTHDLFTNDVLYAEALLDLHTVPVRLLPLVPLFCRALTNMGTKSQSFVELQQRIGAQTGGISVSAFTSDVRGSKEPVAYVVVRGKATSARTGELFSLFTDILLTARLDDKARFKQMASEAKASMEARAVGGGHSLASTRLGAQLSVAGWADELMGGLSALQFVRDLVKRCDSDWPSVQADLEAIRGALLGRQGAVLNLTGDEKTLARAHARGSDFLGALPATSPVAAAAWATSGGSSVLFPRGNELMTVPTQVNYVAKAVDLYAAGGYSLHGSANVINKLISTSWLWDRVRVSGGAYGGFSDFDSHSGQFTFLSYRDPNLVKTLDIYDATPGWLTTLDLDADALTRAIIGTVGDLDAYQLPDSKGYTALMRHLLRVTDDERKQRREEVLGTTLADCKRFGEALACVNDPAKATVAAVCAPDTTAKVAAERPDLKCRVTSVL